MPTGKYRDPNTQQFVSLLGSGQPSGALIGPSALPPRAIGDLWVDSDDSALSWDSDWIYPTLLNGWVNYGGQFGSARYRKMPGGLVVMEGLIRYGSNSVPIFYLPVGYRPIAENIWSGQANPFVLTHMYTFPDGRVQCNAFASGGNNEWITLTTCHHGSL